VKTNINTGVIAILTLIVMLGIFGLVIGINQAAAAHKLRIKPRVTLSGSYRIGGYLIPRPAVILEIHNPTNYNLEVRNLVLQVYVEGVETASLYKEILYIPAGHTVTLKLTLKESAFRAAVNAISATLSGRSIGVEVTGKADVPIRLFGIINVGTITLPFHRIESIHVSIINQGSSTGSSGTSRATVTVKWIASGLPVLEVPRGTHVKAVVAIRGYSGYVTVEVRQDRRFLPDKTVVSRSVYCRESCTVTIYFVAEGGITVRGYFIRVRGSGIHYEQPPHYPPRLRVRG